MDDLSVPLSQFRALAWNGMTILITENKMRTTFLTLPPAQNALGIWGGGGAVELLNSVNWLLNCRLLYWGDIDVHGFQILSRLRRVFPNLRSVMMDEKTLDRFSEFIVVAKDTSYGGVTHLTIEEHLACERVRTNRLLLEQEKIPHSYAAPLLSSLLNDPME